MVQRRLQARLLEFLTDGPWTPEVPGHTTSELARLFEVPVSEMSSAIGDLSRNDMIQARRVGVHYDRLQLCGQINEWIATARAHLHAHPAVTPAHKLDQEYLRVALGLIEDLGKVTP